MPTDNTQEELHAQLSLQGHRRLTGGDFAPLMEAHEEADGKESHEEPYSQPLGKNGQGIYLSDLNKSQLFVP